MSKLIDDFQRFAIYDLVSGDNRFIPQATGTVEVRPRLSNGETYRFIALTTTPQPFGGERLWFRCPVCTSRVGCLYAPQESADLRCRKCWHLRYASELRHRNLGYELVERPRRHLERIESRLFGGWEGAVNWELVALGYRPFKRYTHATTRRRLLVKYRRWKERLKQGEDRLLGKMRALRTGLS